jgi:putative ABC transport system substrate-binding protein
MRRREFVAAVTAVAAVWPFVARAQQPGTLRRIGVLLVLAESDAEAPLRVAALKKGLAEFGWVDGKNVRLDIRWAGGDAQRIQSQASELVASKPDVLIAGATSALAALYRHTRDIPIVFAQVADPVGSGYAANAARPGGNVTGFALYDATIAVKWIELLKQIADAVTRVALVYDPANPVWVQFLRAIEPIANRMGVQVVGAAVQMPGDIERTIDRFASEPNGGLIVAASPLTAVHRKQIIALAAKHRLPAVYTLRYFVSDGGLAFYGVDNLELYRRTASYIDRIFRGEKPGDLPIQYPNKFELVINLRTAKALGLEIPLSVLARTDEVIE